MFSEYYDQLTETHKGILLMVSGLLLLGYQQRWAFLDGLRSIIDLGVFVLAVGLLGYGFYKLDGYKKIMALINKKNK
jgi:hypothetical protein